VLERLALHLQPSEDNTRRPVRLRRVRRRKQESRSR
jgi:hypothetical protein